MNVQAEISLYPLRTATLSRPIERFVGALESAGLAPRRAAMSSTVAGDVDDVFRGVAGAFKRAAGAADVVLIVKISNACPSGGVSEEGRRKPARH